MRANRKILAIILSVVWMLSLSVPAFATQGTQITITTAAQLQQIRQNLGGNYVLANDIDLTGINFEPIGNASTPFTGSFNGNGHTIKSLKIQTAGKDIGLFGATKNAVIENVKLENVSVDVRGTKDGVQGGIGVGALAGRIQQSTIKNCVNLSGTVQVEGKNSLYVGGVIGASYDSNISSCANNASVTGNMLIGGIVGSANHKTGLISNCYNKGTITAKTDTAGGIVGATTFSSSGPRAGEMVEKSVNDGLVQAKRVAGGIIGHANYSPISYCGNTGTVKAEQDKAGGICGIFVKENATSCYNIGQVSGKDCGALFGSIDRNPSYANCYYTTSLPFYGSAYQSSNMTGTEKVTTATLLTKLNSTGAVWQTDGAGPIPMTLKPVKAYFSTTAATPTGTGLAYNANAAVAYAKQNYNKMSSSVLCAEFVYWCVKAGGVIPQGTAVPGYKLTKSMADYLEKVGFEPYTLKATKVGNSYTYKATGENSGKVSVGDVIMFRCENAVCGTKTYKHLAMVTKIDSNGTIYMTERNPAETDIPVAYYNDGKHGFSKTTENLTVYCYHYAGNGQITS